MPQLKETEIRNICALACTTTKDQHQHNSHQTASESSKVTISRNSLPPHQYLAHSPSLEYQPRTNNSQHLSTHHHHNQISLTSHYPKKQPSTTKTISQIIFTISRFALDEVSFLSSCWKTFRTTCVFERSLMHESVLC